VRVRVMYFASVREMIGLSEEEVAAPTGSTIGSLIESLKDSHEQLRHMKNLLVAVNGEFADAKQGLGEGDVVALFLPVSGG
jgi:molybdopterin synthase sulfur carrier subunit